MHTATPRAITTVQRMIRTAACIALTSALVFSGYALAQWDDASALEGYANQYSAFWEAGDFDGIRSLYDPNVVYVVSTGMVLEGNDAVRAFLSGLHDAGFTSITFEEEHVHVLGSLGYQYGVWTLHGAESAFSGYFVAVWHHDGSDWRVVHVGNTAVPVEE